MLPNSTQLGHYRILNLIKRGGMGEVYRAEDTRLPRQVAIKVIQSEPTLYPNTTAKQDAARLFIREMTAIAQLDHPNILPLIDFGEQIIDDSQITYMVMQLRSEGSLSDWLRRRGSADPLPTNEVGQLIRQAASALAYAHSKGFVHQDVKPSNFLIRERNEQPQHPDLLLADFGVAKITGTSKSSANVRGTLEYMAPEQLDGHASFASDQYALGIMTYELLTGRVPFSGTPAQVIVQHSKTTPVVPSAINTRVPKLLDNVILRALAKEPERRFPSTVAFSEAFNLALQGKDINGHSEETQKFGPTSQPIDPLYIETKLMSDNRSFQQRGTLPPDNSTIDIQNTQRKPFNGRGLIIVIAILLILAGSIGVAFAVQNRNANISLTATATAQANNNATALANTNATAQANTNATAQANNNATATAQAQPTSVPIPQLNSSYAGGVTASNGSQYAMNLYIDSEDQQGNLGARVFYNISGGQWRCTGKVGSDNVINLSCNGANNGNQTLLLYGTVQQNGSIIGRDSLGGSWQVS